MIEVAADVSQGSFDLFAASRLGLSAVDSLVVAPFLSCCFFVDLVLLFVPLFEFWVQFLPHISNDSRNVGNPQVRVFNLYLIVDVHSVKKEGAQCLFWGFWGDVVVSIGHQSCMGGLSGND